MESIRTNIVELRDRAGKEIMLMGWLEKKRAYKSVIFIDFRDGSGSAQLVAKAELLGKDKFSALKSLNPESCLEVTGRYNPDKNEVDMTKFRIISKSVKTITPEINSNFQIFDSKYSDFVSKNKHLYLRNSKLRSVFRARSVFLDVMNTYLSSKNFVNFEPPMFTNITLYGADSAFHIDYYGKTTYLNQCSAFYLEAAIPAFERVYSLTPSFRREPSNSKRHLTEYWHLKGEIAFCDLQGIINFVENMIYDVNKVVLESPLKDDPNVKFNTGIGKPPYKTLEYEQAIKKLNSNDYKIEFGKSLGNDEELFLSKLVKEPFWLRYLPRSVEPFPYRINPDDKRTTLTADLVIPGYGEVLGVAEKIFEKEELDKRMAEDFLPHSKETYEWYTELRQFGIPPHSGFGIGVERLIRAMISLDHVKFAIPFPRLYKQHL